MQYKVPQNIDMQDRIVGPLTLVQFLYLLTGGITIYVLFTVLAAKSITLFFILAVPIGLFSFALAFLKIQDQTFGKFVLSFVTFLFKPKTRLWVKEGKTPELVVTTVVNTKDDRIAHKSLKRTQVERLAQTLDSSGRGAKRQLRGRPMVDQMAKQ